MTQIEQFIESIFPSQQPPVDKKSPASIEEAERKRKEDYEAKWDLIYMISAVFLTVGVVTFIMVSGSEVNLCTRINLVSFLLHT